MCALLMSILNMHDATYSRLVAVQFLLAALRVTIPKVILRWPIKHQFEGERKKHEGMVASSYWLRTLSSIAQQPLNSH